MRRLLLTVLASILGVALWVRCTDWRSLWKRVLKKLSKPPWTSGLLAGCLGAVALLATVSAASAKTYRPTCTNDPCPECLQGEGLLFARSGDRLQRRLSDAFNGHPAASRQALRPHPAGPGRGRCRYRRS